MRKLYVINEELERLHSDYNTLLTYLVNSTLEETIEDALLSQMDDIHFKLTHVYGIVAEYKDVQEEEEEFGDIPTEMYETSND